MVIRGHFDGKVLVPNEPVDLPRNQPLVMHVEMAADPPPQMSENIWDVLEKYAGTMDAPPDWSSQHDHYLYGTRKRPENDLK
jgi:hypothetical protein